MASYQDATGPGGGVAVIGASCPCAPPRDHPASSHTNLNIPCILLVALPLRRFLVGREDYGLINWVELGTSEGVAGQLRCGEVPC